MGILIPKFSIDTDESNTILARIESEFFLPHVLLLIKEELPHCRVLKNKYEDDYEE
jgi:hypothetical protein